MPGKDQPRIGDEPGLVLIYMDDSKSTDPYRKEYGDWCLNCLSKLAKAKGEDVGVRMATFRNQLIPKANLKLTGPRKLEMVAVDYQDARKNDDPIEGKKKPDSREEGTSLQGVLDDIKEQTSYGPKRTLVVIFSDGGFEDGKGGSWDAALTKAKALSGVPNLEIVVIGLAEDNTGGLIRKNTQFWKDSGLKVKTGLHQDGDVFLNDATDAFVKAMDDYVKANKK